MKELVFLLEERSSAAMLESLLPRILNSNLQHRLIHFEGKQDLEKQLVRRIRGYVNPSARFIIMRDQDSAPDCKTVKQRLVDLCEQTGRQSACLIRIACRELEAFYVADLAAVESALPVRNIARQQSRRKFRYPDRLGSPSRELKQLTDNVYQKVSGSREIGKRLQLDNTRSTSFAHLLGAIDRMQAELLSDGSD